MLWNHPDNGDVAARWQAKPPQTRGHDLSDVLFYHLTETPLEAALPPLLERSIAREWTIRLRGQNPDRLDFLDRHLWTFADDSFLPHGRAGGAHDAVQPILLTDTDQNANDADVLMLIDGAMEDVAGFAGYERVCVLFDGNDPDATATARSHWKTIQAAGHSCKYWAQEGGRWQQKS